MRYFERCGPSSQPHLERKVVLIAKISHAYDAKRAARVVNRKTNRDEGPFMEFCTKVIAHADPGELDQPYTKKSATEGLEDVIKKVCRERRQRREANRTDD